MHSDLPEIDKNNPEFRYALDFVMFTNRMLYLTGKAGTGKTTFLKYLKTVCDKNMVVLAPTGVAAVNAGGQTIHSFFNIKPGLYVPGDKRLRTIAPPDDPDKTIINDHFRYHRDKLDIIRGLELLVIDEISMVRCDLLDVIDRLLRVFRRREYTPFGGVQVVLIGDTFQLPPIANQNDWNILGQFYNSPFFFSSRVMQLQKPLYIELKKVYRQTDQDFIDLLNRIRINRLNENDLKLLNSRYIHGFSPEEEEDYIILATHNRMVEETNEKRLREIDEPLNRFEAFVEGTFPENSYPADPILKLKEGAQVMFLKNDRNKRYYNGKIGHVLEISEEELIVVLPEGDVISVEREEWSNIRYSWDSKENKVVEEIIGTFVQYPLKLAWSITVHKSQGLTFEKIIADLEEAFAPGQVYVALSRCTSFKGLLLKTPLNQRSIKTDPDVLEFAGLETPSTLLLSELETEKASNFLRRAISAYLSRDYSKALMMILSAMELLKPEGRERAFWLIKYAAARIHHSGTQVLEKAKAVNINEILALPELEALKFRAELRKLKRPVSDQLDAFEAYLSLVKRLHEKMGITVPAPDYVNEISALADELKEAQKAVNEIKKKTKKRKK